MKKILLTVALVGLTFSAHANTVFQKVYEVPGMDASTITEAFGQKAMVVEDGALDKMSNGLKTISTLGFNKFQSKKDGYAIKCKWMGTRHYFNGDVILQAKEGKYRLTVSNLLSDDGHQFIKMNESLKKKCIKDIDAWAEAKYSQVKKLDTNW